MLERLPAWPRHQSLRKPAALKSEIEAFVKDQGLPQGMMPPPATLAQANRQDLLNAVNKAGAACRPKKIKASTTKCAAFYGLICWIPGRRSQSVTINKAGAAVPCCNSLDNVVSYVSTRIALSLSNTTASSVTRRPSKEPLSDA